MSKITKQEVKEVFFKYLKNYGLEVKNPIVTNGYYIINMGEDSVVHFEIKGIRKWLFALWIHETDDGKKYLLNFFGDKIRWINKFKPTSATLSSTQHSINIDDSQTDEEFDTELYEIKDMIYDIVNDILKLKHNRHIAEYGIKGDGDSFIKWEFWEFWYYDIVKPLNHFYVYDVLYVLCHIIQWCLCLKYHKVIRGRKIITYKYENFRVSPLYMVGIEYKDGVDEETMYNTYYKLKNSPLVKLLVNSDECSFMQYKNSEAKRNFYYSKNKEYKE